MADAPMPDPLDDARALLLLARLVYRARKNAALVGVQTAPAAVGELAPIGKRLAEAVTAAEQAGSDAERAAALAAVARAGEAFSSAINDRCEGIRGLIGVALDGVHGRVLRRPGTEGAGFG